MRGEKYKVIKQICLTQSSDDECQVFILYLYNCAKLFHNELVGLLVKGCENKTDFHYRS